MLTTPNPLGEIVLRNGETMTIGVIDAPAPEWRAQLSEFLYHKGQPYLPQIEESLDRPLDNLRSRFFIGVIDDRIACHCVVVGYGATAILGHVFTRPTDRQKGAIKELLAVAMDESRNRDGYWWITLGSEYGSPAHRIYQSLGFQGVAPEHGEMIWTADSSVDPFAGLTPTIRPTRWEDWSSWNLLAMAQVGPNERLPRSPQMKLDGQGSVETSFIELQQRREKQNIQALTLEGAPGIALGWAILSPPADGADEHWLLDAYVHPDYADHCSALIAALDKPSGNGPS